jgi:hypothetical protein
MPEAEIAKAVQLLDLMLEFFADDLTWTRGSYLVPMEYSSWSGSAPRRR